MDSTIKDGERISFEYSGFSEVEAGDIIIFKRDKFICHRLLGKYKANGNLFLIERGDNKKVGIFRSIEAEKLLGRVVMIEREDGVRVSIVRYPSFYIKFKSKIITVIYGTGYKIKDSIFGKTNNYLINFASHSVRKFLNFVL